MVRVPPSGVPGTSKYRRQKLNQDSSVLLYLGLSNLGLTIMSVEETFQQWLHTVPFWQVGQDPEPHVNFVFRYDGLAEGECHVITLVDSGLPNEVTQPLRHPSLGPQVFMTCPKQDVWHPGAYYSTRGAMYQDALRLSPQGPTHATVQLAPRPAKCHNFCELFSGMGSWSLAARACGKVVTVAVENNYRAAQAFRRNHQTPLAEMDVADCTWISKEPIDAACASPPCPAFSTLKGTPGFTDKAATPWRELMVYLRHAQPPFLLLENPSAITKKQHQVRLFMKLSGYRLVSATDVSLSDFTPFQRDRWISIWSRWADPPVPFPQGPHPWLPKGYYHTLKSFACVADPDILVADLQLTAEQVQKLKDPKYSRQSTAQATWQSRLVTACNQCYTIQRLYGQSFDLPEHLLSQFGLHCPLFYDGNVARLFSPWEIARGLLLPPSTRLPSTTSEAWELLGNAVSQLQCAVGVLLLDQIHGGRSRVECNDVLSRMVDQAVQIQDVVSTPVDGWLELVPKARFTQDRPPESPSPMHHSPQSSDTESVASNDTAKCHCTDPWDNASRGSCVIHPDSPDSAPLSDLPQSECASPQDRPVDLSAQLSEREIEVLFAKLESHEQQAIQKSCAQQPTASQGAGMPLQLTDMSPTPFWFPILHAPCDMARVRVPRARPSACDIMASHDEQQQSASDEMIDVPVEEDKDEAKQDSGMEKVAPSGSGSDPTPTPRRRPSRVVAADGRGRLFLVVSLVHPLQSTRHPHLSSRLWSDDRWAGRTTRRFATSSCARATTTLPWWYTHRIRSRLSSSWQRPGTQGNPRPSLTDMPPWPRIPSCTPCRSKHGCR